LESPPRFSFTPEQVGASIENSSPSPPEATYGTQIENNITETEPEPVLPPTLETRKKKKKSSLTLAPEIDPAPTDRQPSPPIDTTKNALLTSTKRKFIPEDDDRFASNIDLDEDEFQFRRPSHSPKKQTNPFDMTRQDQSPIKNVEVTRGSKTPILAKRKVLEPSMFHVRLMW
jgi:hypothetical protein